MHTDAGMNKVLSDHREQNGDFALRKSRSFSNTLSLHHVEASYIFAGLDWMGEERGNNRD